MVAKAAPARRHLHAVELLRHPTTLFSSLAAAYMVGGVFEFRAAPWFVLGAVACVLVLLVFVLSTRAGVLALCGALLAFSAHLLWRALMLSEVDKKIKLESDG